MKQQPFIPSIIDFAYEIIDLHEENITLRRELEHYKQANKANYEMLESSRKHGDEMMGHLLGAIIDPESLINRGQRAILKDQIKNKEVQ